MTAFGCNTTKELRLDVWNPKEFKKDTILLRYNSRNAVHRERTQKNRIKCTETTLKIGVARKSPKQLLTLSNPSYSNDPPTISSGHLLSPCHLAQEDMQPDSC